MLRGIAKVRTITTLRHQDRCHASSEGLSPQSLPQKACRSGYLIVATVTSSSLQLLRRKAVATATRSQING